MVEKVTTALLDEKIASVDQSEDIAKVDAKVVEHDEHLESIRESLEAAHEKIQHLFESLAHILPPLSKKAPPHQLTPTEDDNGKASL